MVSADHSKKISSVFHYLINEDEPVNDRLRCGSFRGDADESHGLGGRWGGRRQVVLATAAAGPSGSRTVCARMAVLLERVRFLPDQMRAQFTSLVDWCFRTEALPYRSGERHAPPDAFPCREGSRRTSALPPGSAASPQIM